MLYLRSSVAETMMTGPRVLLEPDNKDLLAWTYEQPNVVATDVPIPESANLVGKVPNILTGFPWARSPGYSYDLQNPENYDEAKSKTAKRGLILRVISDVNYRLSGKERLVLRVKMGEGKDNPSATFVMPRSHASLALSQRFIFFPNPLEGSVGGASDITIVVAPDEERLGIYFDSESNVAYICGTRYIGELKKRFLSLGMHMVKKNGLGVGFHSSTKEMRVLDRDGRPRQSTMVVMGMSATGKSTLGFANHGLPSEGEEYVRIANDDFSFFHYEDKKFYGSEMNPYNKSNDFTDPDDRFHKGVIMSENNGVQDGKLTYGDVYGPNGRCIVSRRAIDNTFDGVNLPIDGGENVYFIIIQRNPTLPPMMRVRDIDMLIASFLSVETVYTNAENVPPDLVGKTRHQVGANPFILSSMEEEVKAVKKAFEITKGVGICLNTSSYFFRDIKKETSGWLLEQLARDRIDWEMDEFYNMEVPAMSTPDFDDFNLRYHPTAVMTDSDMARKKREYHEMHDRKVVFLRDLGVDERYAEAIRGKS